MKEVVKYPSITQAYISHCPISMLKLLAVKYLHG